MLYSDKSLAKQELALEMDAQLERLSNNAIKWRFQVRFPKSHSLNAYPYASSESSFNWNLWKGDVVELFLGNKKSYLEIQMNPDAHILALEVKRPRIDFHYREIKIETQTYLNENEWSGDLEIELPPTFQMNDLFYNITAIFYDKSKKPIYFSLCQEMLNGGVDFHRPSFFRQLETHQNN